MDFLMFLIADIYINLLSSPFVYTGVVFFHSLCWTKGCKIIVERPQDMLQRQHKVPKLYSSNSFTYT